MAEMHPLNMSINILGNEIPVYFETGIYSQVGDYGRKRFVREDDPDDDFGVEMDLENSVGLQLGDRVNVFTFHKMGACFLVVNHTKNRYNCYSNSIQGLWYRLKDGKGEWGRTFLWYRLRRIARGFCSSNDFQSILKKALTI